MQRVLVLLVELFKSRLDLEHGLFGLAFLNAQVPDFFLESVQFGLLVDANALGFIVLLFDLTELSRHFSDLLLVMLHSRRVICGFQQCIDLDIRLCPVSQPTQSVTHF